MKTITSVCNVQFESNLIEIPWVDLNGLKYSVGTCIVFDTDCRGVPIFGKIRYILFNDKEEIGLYCNAMETMFYDDSLRAYVVEVGNTHVFVPEVEHLFSPFPVIIHRMENNKLYVTIKSAL